MFEIHFWSTQGHSYREKLGWLECNKRRLYFMLIIICKILRLGKPEYLTEIFAKHIPKETARGELLTHELVLPDLHKWHGNSSFQIQGTKSWNSLPTKIRFLPSLSSFKSALLSHLKSSKLTYDDSVFK